MSTLVVDYGMESSFHKSIKSAKSALNKRVDDYVDIERRARSIPSNTDNCSNCAYYVKKKYQQLQTKIDRLNNLDRQVDNFINEVQNIDKRIASRIKNDTKSFEKRTGIGKSNKSIFSSICESIGGAFNWIGDTVSKAWNGAKKWVKDFYEKNKYWINIVVDVVKVAAAVAACIGTGGIALAVGIFFVADAVCDLVYDGAAAYQYYAKGNEAEAERLSGKGGKDAFVWVGGKIDELMGWEFMAGTMGIVYEGISLFAVGYSLYKAVLKPASQILKDLKLDKIKIRSPFSLANGKFKFRSPIHGNFKLNTHFTGDKLWKATTNFFGANAVQQKEVVKLAYKFEKVNKICKFGVSLKSEFTAAKTLLNIQRWKNGYEGVKGTIEKVNKAVNLMKDGKNPFEKTQKAVDAFYEQIKLIKSGGIA